MMRYTSSSETDKTLLRFLLGTNNFCNDRNVMSININITKTTNLWHCEISVNLQRRITVVRLSTEQTHKWSRAVNENNNTGLAPWGQSQSTIWQWPQARAPASVLGRQPKGGVGLTNGVRQCSGRCLHVTAVTIISDVNSLPETSNCFCSLIFRI